MRARIATAMAAIVAAVAMTGLWGAPAQADGTVCSAWTSISSGVLGQVCVTATNNTTNAWATMYNGTNRTVAGEIVVYINGNILHTWCGTGVGQGVLPGAYLSCQTGATRWTASPRYANAWFAADNAGGWVTTPWLS